MAENIKDKEAKETYNSLSGLVNDLYQGGIFPNASYGQQVSQSDTMYISNRWYMISNQRQLISQMYVEHGIVETLVDQPVDDAFREGVEIQSGELDADDIEKLEQFCERTGVFRSITQGAKWQRLFGGGAIVILTDQDPMTPFDLSKVNENTPLEFRPVDLWELYHSKLNTEGDMTPNTEADVLTDQEYYDYYGHKIHQSRVIVMKGKEPPSFIRPRLRGWGLSVLEKLVRSINQYLKNQAVVFELMDEAKIDVYKMKGYNEALLTSNGTNNVSNRIQSANMIKNYNNAVTMDADDDYQQKQMTFTGLSDMLVQIREGICSDLKMPVTKLFGISSAGFNSGEDDIENYNAMIETEIRSKIKYHVVDILGIACQKVFGYVPEDLTIAWPSLRIMSTKDEQDVKNQQYNRVTAAYQMGAIDRKKWAEIVNKENLLGVEVDENDEALEPLADTFLVDGSDKVDS